MDPLKEGKVRTVYDNGDGTLTLKATNRISAFNQKMQSEIPHKGEVLNRISMYIFGVLEDHEIDTHYIGKEKYTDKTSSMTCHKADVIPIEFIARDFLYGSAWGDYKKGDLVIPKDVLPDNPVKASRLKKLWLTPTTKCENDFPLKEGENLESYLDKNEIPIENFSWCQFSTHRISEIIKNLYKERGIILCDHKIEFGYHGDDIIVIDEAGTPDSSRLWRVNDYNPGETISSLDKQILRDYLEKNELKGQSVKLPPELIKEISEKYIEIYEILTETTF